MKWDDEMFEMHQRLLQFLDDHYIMYSYKQCDYVAYPKSEGKPEGYDKWKQGFLQDQKNNQAFKNKIKAREDRKKKPRNPPKVQKLTCKHCGYYYESAYVGSFYQRHNDNCKHKKEE